MHHSRKLLISISLLAGAALAWTPLGRGSESLRTCKPPHSWEPELKLEASFTRSLGSLPRAGKTNRSERRIEDVREADELNEKGRTNARIEVAEDSIAWELKDPEVMSEAHEFLQAFGARLEEGTPVLPTGTIAVVARNRAAAMTALGIAATEDDVHPSELDPAALGLDSIEAECASECRVSDLVGALESLMKGMEGVSQDPDPTLPAGTLILMARNQEVATQAVTQLDQVLQVSMLETGTSTSR